MLSSSWFTVSHGVVCERVGDELMVIVPGRPEVVKLTGEAADVFLSVQAGRVQNVSEALLSELETLGIIHLPGLSRRGLIRAGAIGAGAGIAVLSMPTIAAASSNLESDPDTDGNLDPQYQGTHIIVSGQVDFLLNDSDGEFVGSNPSALTLVSPTDLSGTTVNFYRRSPSNTLEWNEGLDLLGFAGATIIGEFTWGNQTFTVTFSPMPI